MKTRKEIEAWLDQYYIGDVLLPELRFALKDDISTIRQQDIDVVIEMCERMKKDCPNHGYSPDDNREAVECYGCDEMYNSALSDIIAKLQEMKKNV